MSESTITAEEMSAYVTFFMEADALTLDQDPTLAGLDKLQDKLARLSSYRSRLSTIIYKALWEKTQRDMTRSDAQHEYDKEKDRLLSEDDGIKSLKSSELRVGKINNMLATQVVNVHQSEKELSKAEAFFKMAMHCDKTLSAKSDALDKQISIVQMSMYLDPSLRSEMATRKTGGITQ